MVRVSLAAVLVASAPPVVASALAGAPDLEATLRRIVDVGRAAWPAIAVDEGAMVEHLARALPEADALDAIATANAEGLALAVGCARGDPSALETLDAIVIAESAAVGARMRFDHSAVDELEQALREKLLVGTAGTPPRIAQYAARGPFAGWIRVIATREALTLRRRTVAATPPGPLEPVEELVAASDDVEMEHLRTRYSSDFKAAFQDALAALSVEDRNVLRMHLLDGLNIDEMGALFQVHRATAARWIGRARDKVASDTRRLLLERLRLSETELESLMGVVLSQLDVSLQRALSTTE